MAAHDDAPLAGRVALVTGGGRGLGRAFAAALAAAGASVAVLARSADQLAGTVAALEAAGGRAAAYPADVTDPAAVARAVAAAERELGPVDVLVNNAGVGTPIGPAWQVDPDAWWRSLEVNLRGPFLCARAVLPGMVARRSGRIINVSSGAGAVAIPYMSAYVTGKAALTRFTEALAAEAREHGVRAFAIEPGTVRTAMAEEALGTEDGRRWMPWFKRIFDEGRDVAPAYAAELVVLLASGRADRLSGRFISRRDDVGALLARADEVERRELYALRVRTLDG